MRMGPGEGATLCWKLRCFLRVPGSKKAQPSRHNPAVWKTICWSSSSPASRCIYTLLNQTCLLLFSPWHTDTTRPYSKDKRVGLMLLCTWLWPPYNVWQFREVLLALSYMLLFVDIHVCFELKYTAILPLCNISRSSWTSCVTDSRIQATFIFRPHSHGVV